MNNIAIVGFGRFGKTLYRLLKDDFNVMVYTRKSILPDIQITKQTTFTTSVGDIYQSDVIFFAVPIDSFEAVISSHKKYFKPEHLLIDVLSVKIHPQKVFEKHLKGSQTQALLTHPMFGPDSSKNGFEGLPIIMDQFKANTETYDFWINYFDYKKLRVVRMSAEEHDRMAADSQGLTHFIGRLLHDYGLKPTAIDSLGTKKLLEIVDQTCNDTWQLFTNLQHFNPYTKRMRVKVGQSYDKLFNSLIPKRKNSRQLIIGIQGGKGSFNEQAIIHYIAKANIQKFALKYLHTSENVLKALHLGNVDIGQFAIHNSVGGIVAESIHAMAKYKFQIVEEFAIKISHALMVRKDASLSDITTIMSHPQVLAQCKQTLALKYPHLAQTSGIGILIDHAVVAKRLGESNIPKHVATMGSSILAKLYGLTVIEDNLQDAKENYTSFLVVSRI